MIEAIEALPDGKRMAYVEGHIADYLLAGFTTDDLKALVAEIWALREREKLLLCVIEGYTSWRPNVGIIEPRKTFGHGSCCYCLPCGQFKDECSCEHNEIERILTEQEKQDER